MLKSISESLVWPAVIDPAVAHVHAYLVQLQQAQRFSPRVLRQNASVQLASRLRHAKQASAHFAPLLANVEPVAANAFDILAGLPLLTRSDLQANPDAFYCDPPPDHGKISVSSTSGSTGQPVTVRCTAQAYAMRHAVTVRNLGWHRMNTLRTFGAIRANISTAKGVVPVFNRTWGSPIDRLFRTGPAISLNIRAPVPDQLAFLEKFKPAYLLTYPSNLQALVQEMPRRPDGLESIRTIGETLSEELVETVRAAWGVRVHDEYSSQELGCIAAQCEHGSYHCTAETLVVEVLRDDGTPCGPGEIGRVVVTDMINFATAMIRYEIRDYAEVGEACACGRGSPVLKRVVGRVRNMMILPDGRRVWPRFGLKQLGELAPIRQYQVLQTEPRRLEVNLASDAPLSESERDAVAHRIRESTHPDFEIVVSNTVGPLLKGNNQKIEVFKCLI